jgi:signal transduction histidine kinase
MTTLDWTLSDRRVSRTFYIDVGIVALACLVGFLASVQFEIFEAVVAFDDAHPELHSDDLLIALTFGGFALLWFGQRRWRERLHEAEARQAEQRVNSELTARAQAVERANLELAEKGMALEAAGRELAKARDAAVSGSRAKSEFLTNMSHELRTPLAAIIGLSDLMVQRDRFMPGSNYDHHVCDIQRSGRHLLRLIDDVLDTAQLESGFMVLSPRKFDLAEMLRSCCDLIKPLAEKSGITITNAVPDQLVVVGDPGKLKQVLVNLISNAIKFTPRDGRVDIRLNIAAAPQDAVEITVADTGIGMTPPEIEAALETFQQVDGSLARRHEGMGLGLPLAKSLVELHGGVLTIDSAPGAGTSVSIILPILLNACAN